MLKIIEIKQIDHYKGILNRNNKSTKVRHVKYKFVPKFLLPVSRGSSPKQDQRCESTNTSKPVFHYTNVIQNTVERFSVLRMVSWLCGRGMCNHVTTRNVKFSTVNTLQKARAFLYTCAHSCVYW